MFKVISEDFDIRNFLERKRRIKFHRPIHIADSHAYRFDGRRGLHSADAERNDKQRYMEAFCHRALTIAVAGGGDPGCIGSWLIVPASAPAASASRASNSGKRQLKIHRYRL